MMNHQNWFDSQRQCDFCVVLLFPLHRIHQNHHQQSSQSHFEGYLTLSECISSKSSPPARTRYQFEQRRNFSTVAVAVDVAVSSKILKNYC